MLIRRVGSEAVRSAAQLKSALETAKLAEGITIEVQTPEGLRTFELKQ